MSESADCQATLHASHSPQSLRPSRRTSVRSLVCRVGSRFLRTGALTTCRMTRASENLQRAGLTDTLSRGRCLTCGVPAGRSSCGRDRLGPKDPRGRTQGARKTVVGG